MFPTKFEVVSVAASATHQVTLQAWAPLRSTIEKFVPVSAPVPRVPTAKLQRPFDGPSRVSVPVRAAAAGKQYAPGANVTPSRVPLSTVQTSPVSGVRAAYCARKAL